MNLLDIKIEIKMYLSASILNIFLALDFILSSTLTDMMGNLLKYFMEKQEIYFILTVSMLC